MEQSAGVDESGRAMAPAAAAPAREAFGSPGRDAPAPSGFPFAVEERMHPRARRIRITVTAQGRVRLTVPRGVRIEAARAFLRSRIGWVEAALAKARARLQGDDAAGGSADGAAVDLAAAHVLAWDGSDSLLWHGRPMPVRFLPARLARPQLRVTDTGGLELFAAAGLTPAQKTRALKAALLREARLECEDVLLREAARLGVRFASLRLADTRSQWGSCTRAGGISLSWRLLLAPPEVLRYVAVHELCHVVHPDHSPRFWALVARQLPDYAEARDWLKAHGAGLHRWFARG